jgi:hypothetical protein
MMVPFSFDLPADASAARASQIFRPEGRLGGVRIVTDDACPLRITACGFERAGAAAAKYGLAVPAAYLLVGRDAVYVGESGQFAARVDKHSRDPSKSFAREVYTISARDFRLSKQDAIYLQARLMGAVEETGRWKLVNTQPAIDAGLDVSREATLDRMLGDAWQLLQDASCRVFDAGVERPAEEAAPAADETDDVEIGVPVPPGAEALDMVHGDVWARAYVADPRDPRVVIAPGSLMRIRHNASIIPSIRERRERLIGSCAVIPVPDNDGLVRLTETVRLPTRATAAKILSGAHVGSDRWRPARPQINNQ